MTVGRLHLQSGNNEEALKLFEEAIGKEPQNAIAWGGKGVALVNLGKYQEAIDCFDKAIQLDPGYANAHNNLAVIYLTQRPPLVELARWHYQKALAAGQPRNAELEKMLDAQKSAGNGQ